MSDTQPTVGRKLEMPPVAPEDIPDDFSWGWPQEGEYPELPADEFEEDEWGDELPFSLAESDSESGEGQPTSPVQHIGKKALTAATSSPDKMTTSLGLFIREASQYPLLTQSEELLLAERAALGDEDAQKKLVEFEFAFSGVYSKEIYK